MSRRDQSKKTDMPKIRSEVAKPALLLFGKDVSADEIVTALKAESKRQLETGEFGRRMVRIEKKG
jgi:hypothetical protein